MSLDLTQADERFPQMGKLNIRLEFRNGSESIYQQRLLEGPAQCGLRKKLHIIFISISPICCISGTKIQIERIQFAGCFPASRLPKIGKKARIQFILQKNVATAKIIVDTESLVTGTSQVPIMSVFQEYFYYGYFFTYVYMKFEFST